MKLHASGEDYLETILVLQKKRGMVRSVDVARHMEVSKLYPGGGFETHFKAAVLHALMRMTPLC